MFQIAICDDDKYLCAELEKQLLKYGQNFQEKVEVEVFYNGQDLWQTMENGYEADLLFLDIRMQYLDGIELGKRIRDMLSNDRTQIVYISEYDSYAMELFQVRPLHFLKKPLKEKAVTSVVQKAWQLLEKQKQHYCYYSGKNMYKVLVQDILYFSSQGKKITLHTKTEEREFYSKLSEVIASLKNFNFISIHKSYFVNFLHITEVRRNEIILTNGETLPISNSKKETVQQFVLATMRSRKK